MQHLYTENYKILLKEIREDLNKWKIIVFPDGKLSSNVITPWVNSTNSAAYVNIPTALFWKTEQADLKVYVELQETQNSPNILEKSQNWRTHTYQF